MNKCHQPHKLFINLNVEYIRKNKLNVICGMPCCESSRDAHKLLSKKGCDFECACWHNNKKLLEEVKEKHNHCTCPVIFIKGEFVGGYRDLKQKLMKDEKTSSDEIHVEKVKDKTNEKIKEQKKKK